MRLVVTGLSIMLASQSILYSAEPEGDDRAGAGDAGAAERCFTCTQVIGYSQVGQPNGGWYVTGGVFESIVGAEYWQLLWQGGAGVDRWRKADYPGWSNRIISPCAANADAPDRVLLSISGPYGADEEAWAEAIEATVEQIREKIPSARRIVLQPVVGGRGGETCRGPGGGRVRASWQHAHIANAIAVVEQRYADRDTGRLKVVAGFNPQVRDCDDYRDGLGHLTPEGAQAAGRAIAEHYAVADAACAAAGHRDCGKTEPE